MRLRLTFLAGLVALLAAGGDARPAEPAQPATPAVVVRLASVDELIADAKLLIEVSGKADADQVEGLLKGFIGPKGVEGLDTSKPIGLYARVGPNVIDSEGVLLVPVADEKALLDYVGRLGVAMQKQDSGAYKFDVPNSPQPGFLRFANGYAYVTVGEEKTVARDRLLPPAKVFDLAPPGVLSLAFNMDGVPENLKQLVVTQLELGIAQAKEKKEPNETPAQQALRLAAIDEVADLVKAVIKEGGQGSVTLDLDRQARELSLAARFAAKPGTPLAKRIAEIGAKPTLSGALYGKDAALFLGGAVSLPEGVRKQFEAAIDEAAAKALKDQPNAEQRALAEQALKAATPTLKAGVLDAGVSLRGPSAGGKYTLVVGAAVKDGAAVDKFLRQVADKAGPGERALFKLDAAKVGGVGIHEIKPELFKEDANAAQAFGEGNYYLAVAADAVYLTRGADALAVMKEMLASQPRQGPALRAEVSFRRLAPLMGQNKDTKAAPEVARKVFAAHPDGDRLALTLEGGKELTLRGSMKAQVLRFFLELDEAKKKEL